MTTITLERPKAKRHGAKPAKAAKPRKTAAERFWSKVDKTAGFFHCWLWTGGMRTDGYGIFHVSSKVTAPAHVYAQLGDKPLPRGFVVMHSCNNPLCCNPLHGSLGTQRANVQQAERQHRNTHAKMTRETIRTALTLAADGVSAQVIAEKLGRNPTQVRTLFRGQTHVAITGIPRNAASGGRGKGRDKQIFRDALAFMDAADKAPAVVVAIAKHPKFTRTRKPRASAAVA